MSCIDKYLAALFYHRDLLSSESPSGF